MITHDPDEAIFMSDRICMMTNGPHARVVELMEIEFERPRDRDAIQKPINFMSIADAYWHSLTIAKQKKRRAKRRPVRLPDRIGIHRNGYGSRIYPDTKKLFRRIFSQVLGSAMLCPFGVNR